MQLFLNNLTFAVDAWLFTAGACFVLSGLMFRARRRGAAAHVARPKPVRVVSDATNAAPISHGSMGHLA